MTGIFSKTIHALTLSWLTGPIFGKELRVASRRKRFYLMRLLYLVLMMAMMAIVWMAVTATLSHSRLYSASRMAEASKIIVASITWFQFIAAQLIAVVIFSTAINSEIYNRTLYTLMTTPITSFQIITGKLFSRIWQIVLLMAISLPLLAMLRVFGGIPWAYLVETLCLTACTVLFIGAVTLLFSILFRRAYVVIIVSVITLIIIFALIPMLIFFLDDSMGIIPVGAADETLACISPHVMMAFDTDRMFSGLGTRTPLYWFVPCIHQAISSLLVLWAACARVRKTALKHMTPKLTRKKYKMPSRKSKTFWLRRPFFMHSIIQRTIGTGMIWKEFLHPVLGKFKKMVFVSFILMILAFLISTFWVVAFEDLSLFAFVMAGSVIGIVSLAILFTIIIPATYITSEKEAGTWLILMTTCYSDLQILGGKMIGILRRIIIVWLPFLVIYYAVSYFSENPFSTFIKLVFSLLLAIFFVIATGLYFSSRFKHTTTAVICNLALVGILWVGIPGLLLTLNEAIPYSVRNRIEEDLHVDFDDSLEIYWAVTPPGMVVAVIENTYDSYSFHRWAFSKLLIIYTIIHLLAILFYLWRTKANLRKRIS